jgi:hypothetical protein
VADASAANTDTPQLPKAQPVSPKTIMDGCGFPATIMGGPVFPITNPFDEA